MKIYRLSKINKSASMSLYVDGVDMESSMRTLSEIAWKLNGFLFEKWMDKSDKAYFGEFRKSVPEYDIITIDGVDSVDSPVGVINFYLDGIKAEREQYFIDQIKTVLGQNNIGIGKVFRDKSKMYDIPVIRINIVSNRSSEFHIAPPKLNMANNNAFFIFNTVLQVNRDLWDDGGFEAADLKKRIEYYEGEKHFPSGAEYEKTDASEMLKDVDFLSGKKGVSNYDDPRIRSILSKIKQICDWALENGYSKLYLA